jgi:zinc transport system permease protein
MLLIILIALTVVMSMSIMGMLLVTSLLVIPAATALQLGRSFRSTIIIAVILGVLSVTIGLAGAYRFNLPAAGAIVILLVFTFFGSVFYKNRLKR